MVAAVWAAMEAAAAGAKEPAAYAPHVSIHFGRLQCGLPVTTVELIAGDERATSMCLSLASASAFSYHPLFACSIILAADEPVAVDAATAVAIAAAESTATLSVGAISAASSGEAATFLVMAVSTMEVVAAGVAAGAVNTEGGAVFTGAP